MSSYSDPERSKKAKKMALLYLIFALLVYFIGLVYAAVLAAILVFYPKIIRYINEKRGVATEEGGAIKLNFGKIFRVLIYVTFAAIALYFLLPYFMNADTSKEQKAGPLNSLIFTESVEGGAGLAMNNGSYGIQLSTGSSTVGTTFILSTIRNETGWPSFGADIYSPKGGATLKVTYIDLDNPKKNIRFKKIGIPAEYRFRYANKYKLSDYRASISKGNTEELPDKGQTAYRIDPMNHDIKVEVYVPPNSYVELSNVAIIRNW